MGRKKKRLRLLAKLAKKAAPAPKAPAALKAKPAPAPKTEKPKKKAPVKTKYGGGDTAFMFFMADWQLGKKDYGVENTIKRYEVALQDAVNRIKELRKANVAINEIYMVGLGDLTENCYGFYDLIVTGKQP